jgi:hypothetical protein
VTGEGAAGRLRAVAGALLLVAAGGAAAASPGGLHSSDPGTWVAAALAVAGLALLCWSAATLLWRRRPETPAGRFALVIPWRDQIPILICLVVAALAAVLLQLLPAGKIPPPPEPTSASPSPPPDVTVPRPSAGSSVNAAPYAIGLVALIVVAFLIWVLVLRLRARAVVAASEVQADDPLAAAIRAAMLDLSGEPDPRRAVIKAYASAERVLNAHGLPRQPAEAPLEYLDRVLRELGAQAGTVDRLTVLYENAAFSTHLVGEPMRAEALAAFDGLRRSLSAAGSAAAPDATAPR